jgi:hypothetical protein
MSKNNFYWKCEFENANGETVTKTVYAKTTRQAFKYTYEMGVRICMSPKYETLREATDEEVKEFKKEIKKRVKNNLDS